MGLEQNPLIPENISPHVWEGSLEDAEVQLEKSTSSVVEDITETFGSKHNTALDEHELGQKWDQLLEEAQKIKHELEMLAGSEAGLMAVVAAALSMGGASSWEVISKTVAGLGGFGATMVFGYLAEQKRLRGKERALHEERLQHETWH